MSAINSLTTIFSGTYRGTKKVPSPAIEPKTISDSIGRDNISSFPRSLANRARNLSSAELNPMQSAIYMGTATDTAGFEYVGSWKNDKQLYKINH